MQARALAMDFSKTDGPQWDVFQAEIENLDVGVLGTSIFPSEILLLLLKIAAVNNVGRSHSFPADFIDAPAEEVDNILAININATVKVTRTVLPGMLKR